MANPEALDKLQARLERVPRCSERSVSTPTNPAFASICQVSIHLEISATVLSATEELPNLCSFRKASAARSPMMMQGAMVLPVVTRGMGKGLAYPESRFPERTSFRGPEIPGDILSG